MKPVIAITAECKPDPGDARTRGTITLNWNYAEMIARAGGLPIVIPPTADPEGALALADGWLIPGGRDIDASEWGEENHPKVELQDPSRFAIEKEIFRRADPDLPVLGICYGCQALNVLHGGSLHQYLPDMGGGHHEGGVLDPMQVEPDSKLARIVESERVEGKSYHHQGIARLGSALRTCARHGDGTIEAIESTDRPWLIGVQWHPERTPEDEATRRLFRAFVDAAAAYRAKRSAQVAGSKA